MNDAYESSSENFAPWGNYWFVLFQPGGQGTVFYWPFSWNLPSKGKSSTGDTPSCLAYSCQTPFRHTNLALYYGKDHHKVRAHSARAVISSRQPTFIAGYYSKISRLLSVRKSGKKSSYMKICWIFDRLLSLRDQLLKILMTALAHCTNQETNCLFPELSCGVASEIEKRNLLISFSYMIFFPCFSKEISVVLSIIVTLGNFMNGGTNRGQADGFQLSVLNK